MAVKVRIPTPLQKLTAQKGEVEIKAANVKELIQELERSYPGMKERLCDEAGKVRRFVNIYLNEEDIRFLKQEETALKDGDEISIVPAIAGGIWRLAKKAFHLYFPQKLIKEPVMFTVAKECNVFLNIRRARITSEVGEATVELEGSSEDLARAEKAFREKGVKVENVLGDIVEG